MGYNHCGCFYRHYRTVLYHRGIWLLLTCLHCCVFLITLPKLFRTSTGYYSSHQSKQVKLDKVSSFFRSGQWKFAVTELMCLMMVEKWGWGAVGFSRISESQAIMFLKARAAIAALFTLISDLWALYCAWPLSGIVFFCLPSGAFVHSLPSTTLVRGTCIVSAIKWPDLDVNYGLSVESQGDLIKNDWQAVHSNSTCSWWPGAVAEGGVLVLSVLTHSGSMNGRIGQILRVLDFGTQTLTSLHKGWVSPELLDFIRSYFSKLLKRSGASSGQSWNTLPLTCIVLVWASPVH